MAAVLKPAREHSYRLSVYQRRVNDFYPTPSELAISLAVGLTRLGLDLPRVALDPCGGDGALRRSLMPFGVDVRLSDLYPDMYPAADGYVTSQPLDASEPEHLKYAFELAGADCTAIITNTPHNTAEACAIVEKSDRACRAAARRICRNAVQVDLGRRAGAIVLSQPAVLFRRNPLLLAPSVDPWERRKPDACLRVVRLAEDATKRPDL